MNGRSSVRSLVVIGWVICILALFGSAEKRASGVPTNRDLNQAYAWLKKHPPHMGNMLDRRAHMKVIQAAADHLTPGEWKEYVKSAATQPTAADAMEREGVLYYLSRATKDAIQDIRRMKVKRGVIAWHLYNMGYVFKTPDACFGIDLHFRGAEKLADQLEFLLVTHEHGDHRSDALMDAMIAKGRPVVTSFYPGSRRIDTKAAARAGEKPKFEFGPVRVRVDIGDHHHNNPTQLDNMLMYQIDCGALAGHCTIYHSGDASNLAKILPDGPVDIFIPHVQVGLKIDEAVEKLRPKVTLVSHVLELGHSPTPPDAWRWSFDFVFNEVKSTATGKAVVLTWGERWAWK